MVGRLLDGFILVCLEVAWRWICSLGIWAAHVSPDVLLPAATSRNFRCELDHPPSQHHQSSDAINTGDPEKALRENTDQSTALGISTNELFKPAQEFSSHGNCQHDLDRKKPKEKDSTYMHISTTYTETRTTQLGKLKPYKTNPLADNTLEEITRILEEEIVCSRNPRAFRTAITQNTACSESGEKGIYLTATFAEIRSNEKKQNNSWNITTETPDWIIPTESRFELIQTRKGTAPINFFVQIYLDEEMPSTRKASRTHTQDDSARIIPALLGAIRAQLQMQDQNLTPRIEIAASLERTTGNWEDEMRCSHASHPINSSCNLKNRPIIQNEPNSRLGKGIVCQIVLFSSGLGKADEKGRKTTPRIVFEARQSPNCPHPDTKMAGSKNLAATQVFDTPRRNRAMASSLPPRNEAVAAGNNRAEPKRAPTPRNRAVFTDEMAALKVLSPKKEWRWRATSWHTLGNSGTAGVWCGDGQRQIVPVLLWDAEYWVAQSNCNRKLPKGERGGDEDSRYAMENSSFRRDWTTHWTGTIHTNQARTELKRQLRIGDHPQHSITKLSKTKPNELTNTPTLTMTNLPLPPKPAESTPGELGPEDYHPREPNSERRMTAVTQGNYLLTMGQTAVKMGPEKATNKPTESPANVSGAYGRQILPIPKSSLRRLAAAAAAAQAAKATTQGSSTAGGTPNGVSAVSDPAPMDTDDMPASQAGGPARAHTLRFLLHPVDQPPSCDTSAMKRLGNAADNGDNVLVVDGGPRVDTPHLPLRLLNSPPPLMPITEEAMDVVNDGGEEMEGVEDTPTPRLAPSDAPAVTMPKKGAPAASSTSALVFGAFLSPAPTSPTFSITATRASTPSEGGEESGTEKFPSVPPARHSTPATDGNRQLDSNTAELAALELSTPRPAALALAAPGLGNARDDAVPSDVNDAPASFTTSPVKRTLSPIDFDDAEFVSSGSEEGEIKEDSPAHLPHPPSSRAARLAIPQLCNGKRGPVVTRERFSSSPSFESEPRTTPPSESSSSSSSESQPSRIRVVADLDEREDGLPLRLRKFCVQPRTRQDEAPHREGASSWVNVSAVRTTLSRQDLKDKACELAAAEEDSDSSIPALVSPSDSEESNESESYDSFPFPRNVPIINDRGSVRPASQENDTVLPTGILVRDLAYVLDRVTVAPPAPEVDDNARGILLAQAIRRVVDHNSTIRTRRIAEDDHTGQPIRDAFEVSLTHARLVLDQARMATHHEPIDLEDLARRYQEDLRSNIGAATLTQFTNATLCRVAVPVYGDRFRVSERWATPRTPLGAAFRVFSEWARVQGVVFMTGIGLEVSRRPGFVAVISILKICVLEFLRRALRLLLHYGHELDESILHESAHLPLPFLDGNQNSQLRMATHALAVSGRGVLAKLANDFMGLRFRDPHLIAFFNYSGMLELVGPDAEHFEARAMIAASALNITRVSEEIFDPFAPVEPEPFQLTRRNGAERPVPPQPSPAARDAHNPRSMAPRDVQMVRPTAPRVVYTRPASPRPTSIPAPRLYYPHGRGHVRNPAPIPRPVFSRNPMPPKPSSSTSLATRE
ncbi:hypothetical protein C8R47DRAFT_1252614 [Mycena vitilis]|nr:hypothetical protein C8R47DRAFT_1252614 [Mycena vitilis]